MRTIASHKRTTVQAVTQGHEVVVNLPDRHKVVVEQPPGEKTIVTLVGDSRDFQFYDQDGEPFDLVQLGEE